MLSAGWGHAASRLLDQLVTSVDQAWPGTRPTLVELDTRWPAYALPDDSPLRAAITDAGAAFGVELTAKIAGPANMALP